MVNCSNLLARRFNNWGLKANEGMALLGVEGKPRHFAQFRQNKSFPMDLKLLKRIEYLLKIGDALRTNYPTNPSMVRRLMRQANSRLHKRTPLNTMISDGEKGLDNVLCQLDCTFAWDQSGSKAS